MNAGSSSNPPPPLPPISLALIYLTMQMENVFVMHTPRASVICLLHVQVSKASYIHKYECEDG